MPADSRHIADLAVGHGLRKCRPCWASSSLLGLATFDVVRFGSSYEFIQDMRIVE